MIWPYNRFFCLKVSRFSAVLRSFISRYSSLKKEKQKLQCVPMCLNVPMCTLKSIETHYSLRFVSIRIDGPFGGLAVPGLDVRDFAILFSVSKTPNVSLRLTLKFTCSILRHTELRNKQRNQQGHLTTRKGRWSGSFLGA